jgi:uncharacterized protein (DUF1330 family)
MSINLVAMVDLTEAEAGRQFEDRVLELLKRHGGRLERRFRGTDGLTEVHLLWFPSREAYEAFLADPRRAEIRDEFGEAAPTGRVVEVEEVK